MHGHPVSKSTRLTKNALKKISIVVVSIIFAFAFVYAIPQKEAKAFPIAIPAGITIGAGVYTLGAIGLATVIGPSSPETEERMKAHAAEVWAGSTQLSKDAMQTTMNAARDATTSLIGLEAGFIDWLGPQIDSVIDSFITAGNIPNAASSDIVIPGYRNLPLNNANWVLHIGLVEGATGNAFCWGTSCSANALYVLKSTTSGDITINAGSKSMKITTAMTGMNVQGNVILAESLNSVAAVAAIAQRYLPTAGAITVANNDYAEIYNYGRTYGKEMWETMRDAGLVIGLDNVAAFDPATGQRLRYNSDADTYTGVDGGVFTGTPAFEFPRLRKREKATDIPQAGVWVDLPTYVPAEKDLDTPADVPHTITHITTGTTVGNPDMPLPGGGTPTTPTDPTPKPLPRIPGSGSPVPIAIFLVFFDLLRAILMYLVRMFNWIVTIPTVQPIPIDNPYFQWFRHAKILGVYPYTLVMSLATFFLGFSLVKSIRRFLP